MRSYVLRGRLTVAQRRAVQQQLPRWELSAALTLDVKRVFGGEAPLVLEIGFGNGEVLLQLARSHPQSHFIGVETHLSGIGSLLRGIEAAAIENIRLYRADALQVLRECIPQHSLNALLVFFPDPWPKKRHHKRRLLQPDTLPLLLRCLAIGGQLHIATDCDDYARDIAALLAAEPKLGAVAVGQNQYCRTGPQGQVLSRFEARARHDGRKVSEWVHRRRS